MRDFTVDIDSRGWAVVNSNVVTAATPAYVKRRLDAKSACPKCNGDIKQDCAEDVDGFSDVFYVCRDCGHIMDKVAELSAKPKPCKLCGTVHKLVGIDMTEVSYAIGECGNMLPGFTTYYNVCIDCVDAFIEKVRNDVEQAYADGYCGDE